MELLSGRVMVLHGLKASSELNGCHVEVLASAPCDERSRVAARALDTSERKLLVKASNMRPRGPYERTRPLAELAPALAPFVYVRSADGLETNLLVLLHGLGDTAENFAGFGRKLELPQTSLLALTAPSKLPFEMGSGWYAAFEQDGSPIAEPARPGDRRRAEGLRASRIAVQTVLRGLVDRCNWRPSELFILGFSQGGTVALDVATHSASPPFGGAVGLSSACLLAEQDGCKDGRSEQTALRAPLLSLHGTLDEVVPITLSRATHDALRARLAAAPPTARADGAAPVRLGRDGGEAPQHEFVELAGGRHTTPQSAEHVRPLIAFFGRHLLSRSPTLEADAGVIEVTRGVGVASLHAHAESPIL
ncbi:hypothetical protein KFE25_009343 [Diacronema lutheri]|uniref:Phospholipase/carboxylesterase/thioesterase domain-containing protein n=1 Tax=Diacronema lutheri TaxID=2081491 RepID=A0A8J5XY55_DIALT|nr:hypothetical protein KFE25_009343 [Diacronema lutheri]